MTLSRNLLAGCILLAVFIGSVVFELLSLDPRRRLIALIAAVAAGALMFFLLMLLVN